MHEQYIIDDILGRLNTEKCNVRCISFMADEISLTQRLRKDIIPGVRTENIIVRSLSSLPMHERLDTEKFDISKNHLREAAETIARGEF